VAVTPRTSVQGVAGSKATGQLLPPRTIEIHLRGAVLGEQNGERETRVQSSGHEGVLHVMRQRDDDGVEP